MSKMLAEIGTCARRGSRPDKAMVLHDLILCLWPLRRPYNNNDDMGYGDETMRRVTTTMTIDPAILDQAQALWPNGVSRKVEELLAREIREQRAKPPAESGECDHEWRCTNPHRGIYQCTKCRVEGWRR